MRDIMLPEQTKAIFRICKEYNFSDIYELQKVLLDNYDKPLLSTQWPVNEKDMYLKLKMFFCGKS